MIKSTIQHRIPMFIISLLFVNIICIPCCYTENYLAYPGIQYKYIEGVNPTSLILDVYTPTEAHNLPVLLYVHGGGWVSAGRSDFYVSTKPNGFTQQGYIFVSTNFRLVPEAEFPAHCQDIASAVAWLYENISDYGGDPERIYITGHSSGAHLAPLVGTDERYLKENGLTLNVIKAVILCHD